MSHENNDKQLSLLTGCFNKLICTNKNKTQIFMHCIQTAVVLLKHYFLYIGKVVFVGICMNLQIFVENKDGEYSLEPSQ